jgi:hypothetical protein
MEAGLSRGETLVVVEGTVWNKFGVDRGQLWADINRAAERVARTDTGGSRPNDPRPVHKAHARKVPRAVQPIKVNEFLAREHIDPKWMIEGIWSDKSHGIIAGEPKTRKSYIAIDIAVSVATGTKCFGYFEVAKAAPVLMIQEEVADAEMSKRLRWIIESKGLSGNVERGDDGAISVELPHDINLYLHNRKGFDLSNTDKLQELTNWIHDLEIKLVILDPLQMMLGEVDENRTSELRPILVNLLRMKEATGCGVMILHHYNKASAVNPKSGGQRMSGSHALHGWIESALYLNVTPKQPYVTTVQREFRNFPPMSEFDVEFLGHNSYEVMVSEQSQVKPESLTPLEIYVMKHQGVSVMALAKSQGIDTRTLVKYAEKSRFLSIRREPSGNRPPMRRLYFGKPAGM